MSDRFPILFGWGPKALRDKEHVGAESVPWAMLAPHEEQAKWNHGQTLARLAERGGLSVVEMAALLEDRKWRPMPIEDAWAIVRARLP